MTKKQVMIWRIILLLIIFVSIGSYFILTHKEKDENINDVKIENVEVAKTAEESDLKENNLKEKKFEKEESQEKKEVQNEEKAESKEKIQRNEKIELSIRKSGFYIKEEETTNEEKK